GDTLLLETTSTFLTQYKNSTDYFLISGNSNYNPPDYSKSWIAWTIMAAMVSTVTFGLLSMFQAYLLAAELMIITKCCRAVDATSYIDWSVLLVIAATLGIGNALQYTDAATVIAGGMSSFAQIN